MARTSYAEAPRVADGTAQVVLGAFYIRISKEGLRSDAEVEAQAERYREMCRRYAEGKHLSLDGVRIVVETDVSGGLALEERGLGPLVDEVEAGTLGWILSPDVDRFGRDTLYGTVAWRRITQAGGRVLFADEDIDSADDFGDPQKDFEQALVQGSAYRRKVSRRFDASVRDAIERGIHSGSVAPIGYTWPGTEIDLGNGKRKFKKSGPLEATETLAGVREAFALVGSEEPSVWSWRDIILLTGAKSTGSARNLLTNRVYLGEARSGEYVKTGAHEAATDEETFERVQRRLGAKAEEHGGKARPSARTARALAKVLRCSDCGGVLSPDSTHWRCKRTGCTSYGVGIATEVVLPYVLSQAQAAHEFLHLGFEVDAATVSVFEEAVRDAERKAKEAAAALGLKVEELPAQATPMQALKEARSALRAHESSFGWIGQSEDAVAAMIAAGDPETLNGFLRETVRVFVSRCGRHAKGEARLASSRCRVVVLQGGLAGVETGVLDDAGVPEVVLVPAETAYPLPVSGEAS
jgi:hypothetical protein